MYSQELALNAEWKLSKGKNSFLFLTLIILLTVKYLMPIVLGFGDPPTRVGG